MIRSDPLATDCPVEEFIGHQQTAGESVANNLFDLGGRVGRSAESIKIIEQLCGHINKQVMTDFVQDCEPNAVFVDVVGIEDPGPFRIEVRLVVPIDRARSSVDVGAG